MPQPLILLTRPQDASERLARMLRNLNAETLIAPLQTITRTGTNAEIKADEALIVTSSNAAEILAGQGGLTDIAAHVVGDRTAGILEDAGAKIDLVVPTASALVRALMDRRSPLKLHYVRGQYVALTLDKSLLQVGHKVRSSIIYSQENADPSLELRAALEGDRTLIVPLYSARSAKLMNDLLEDVSPKAKLISVCISEHVKDQCTSAAWSQHYVSEEPSGSAMVGEIERLVARFY